MGTAFFLASKLFWFVIRPESLLVWAALAVFAFLLLGRRRIALWLSGGLAVFVLALSIWPLGNLFLAPLERRFPVEPEIVSPRGIIVLGGGERAQMRRVWGIPAISEAGDRYIAAIALANRFPEAKLIFSGGSGAVKIAKEIPESEVAREIFTAAGIDAARLVLEGASRNTDENARFLARDLDSLEGPWVLVTSAYHLPRAVSVFCEAGYRRVIPYPVDHRSAGWRERMGWKLAENLQDMNYGAKEWIGAAVYWLTGRSETLFSPGC